LSAKVEALIGCPVCDTALFRLVSVERNAGVRENILEPILKDYAGDHLTCLTCGGNLGRVEE
jgi:hypothetical protein